jgi:hypothetical protein
MKKSLFAVAAAALLAANFPAGAQQNAPAAPAETRVRPDTLFTPAERDQFREKMRAAKTREERAEIEKQMRGTMEQRAKEKGITLPQRREAGERPRRGQHGPQLLSTEERDKFRERMRSAKTPEERAAVRKDMHSAMQQRAKEKGVTLPRGPAGRPGANREGGRPQLFTSEERSQYREKMRAAKTPEERAALRKQMRELTEQRAKEKGITLPQRRGRDDAPKGAGPAGKS